MTGFATRAVHGPRLRREAHGALRPPVYDTVAFEFESSLDIQHAFEGRKQSHSYSRISNPTVEELEQRVRALSDGIGVIAVSSGMAAIANVLMLLGGAGCNVVTSPYLFGNTYSLLEHTLKPWGLEVRYVDLGDAGAVSGAIDDRTRAVFFEIVTNPQLQIVDVPALTAAAHARGVPVLMDGTLTTPYLFRSKDHGVDVELHSSTKYMSGGATAMGGLIVDNGTFDWSRSPRLSGWARRAGPHALLAALRREVYRNLGACLSAHNANLHILGLETMALRIRRSCENALSVAQHLEQHPRVCGVSYPGLKRSPYHALTRRLLPRGAGGLLTLGLSDRAACFAFMDRLKLIRRATNINDNKTLVLHPASTIFCEYSPEERARMGVGEGTIRLSVGIEDVEDLIADLDSALETT